MENYIYVEKVTGTGAAISITGAGFKPQMVEIINSEGLCTLKHVAGMAAAAGYKIKSGIDTTSADTVSVHSLISSGGVTLTDRGCTIGTDSDVNVNGEDLYVICYR